MWAKEADARKVIADRLAEHVAACSLDLPALVGSEKQVKWAQDIRAKVIGTLGANGIKWDAILAMSGDDKVKAELDKIMQTSAKWWIDNGRGACFFGTFCG
jgi:hypothetical protein